MPPAQPVAFIEPANSNDSQSPTVDYASLLANALSYQSIPATDAPSAAPAPPAVVEPDKNDESVAYDGGRGTHPRQRIDCVKHSTSLYLFDNAMAQGFDRTAKETTPNRRYDRLRCRSNDSADGGQATVPNDVLPLVQIPECPSLAMQRTA